MPLSLASRDKCYELCVKRIEIERALNGKAIDFEKCLRICKAFAVR
jgi:hypothetical protein